MTPNGLPWSNRAEVRKGAIGEFLVDEFLRGKKIIPYKPDYDGAHPFDRLCATADKKSIFIADVKAKPKREHYPDTGIDLRHYGDYTFIQKKYSLRVFIFFVDEKAQWIYGNWLSCLEEPVTIEVNGRLLDYPLKDSARSIIYFPVANMQVISRIAFDKALDLMRESTRNPIYDSGQKGLF